MSKRTRMVEGERCPRCRAEIGEKCRSYKGRNCAPHVIYEEDGESSLGPAESSNLGGRPSLAGTGGLVDPKREWTQAYLF